jgi:hypothetical protein
MTAPTRVEMYRQANRAERVAREAAATSTGDVVTAIALGLVAAGNVVFWVGAYYEDKAKKAARR